MVSFKNGVLKIEQSKEVGRLAGRSEHSGGAALQLGDLGGHIVAGGVLQAGVEIAAGLQVKELAHILGGSIFEGSALNNGDLAGLAAFGAVACLDGQGFHTQFVVHIGHLIRKLWVYCTSERNICQ